MDAVKRRLIGIELKKNSKPLVASCYIRQIKSLMELDPYG